MVSPVNFTAGGSLKRELDLEAVSESIRNKSSITVKDSETAEWQLPIHFESGTVILYRTGKYILRGGSSYDSLSNTKTEFTQLLENVGISTEEITYKIQNIVFTDEVGSEIDLLEAVVTFGFENTEYEPEQFPAIIYRPPEYDAVALLFSNGKMVITGTKDESEAEDVAISIKSSLSH
jgi:transcription initiation factor TFIID TATA-box-binding protein